MKLLGNLDINSEVSGAFKSYTDFPENPKLGTWAFIHKSLMICVEIEDAPVWYPLTQERNTFVFEQQTPSASWIIEHAFGSENVVIQCFDSNGNVINPSSIKAVDENAIEIKLPEAITGKAIAIYGKETGVGARGSISGGSGGGIPIGGILAFTKMPSASSGFLPCTGFPYSKLEYPDLFRHLQVEETPDFTDRYLKMIGDDLSPLQTVAWQIPDHNHSTAPHSHEFVGDELPEHNHTQRYSDDYKGTSYFGSGSSSTGNKSTESVSAGTPSGTISSENLITLGVRGSFGSGENSRAVNFGASVEVDHVGVVYCIKAANGFSDAGLAELDGVRQELETCKQKVSKLTEEVSKLTDEVSALKAKEPVVFFGHMEHTSQIPAGTPANVNGTFSLPIGKAGGTNNIGVNGSGEVVIPVSGLYRIHAKMLMSLTAGSLYVHATHNESGNSGYISAGSIQASQRDVEGYTVAYLEKGATLKPKFICGTPVTGDFWCGLSHSMYSVELIP